MVSVLYAAAQLTNEEPVVAHPMPSMPVPLPALPAEFMGHLPNKLLP